MFYDENPRLSRTLVLLTPQSFDQREHDRAVHELVMRMVMRMVMRRPPFWVPDTDGDQYQEGAGCKDPEIPWESVVV
jgi:hypothetical protein